MKFMRLVSVITVIILMMSFTPSQFLSEPWIQKQNTPDNPFSVVEPLHDITTQNLNKGPVVLLSEEINPAADPSDGVLDPVIIEQSGKSCSGNISARTDTNLNTGQELEVDTEHDWVASTTDVRIWNLQQLYALNGTFDEGLPGINIQPNGTVGYYPVGWTSNSVDTSTYADDVQLSSYESADDTFVTVENIGGKVGQNEYGHDVGVKITWAQTVYNLPYTEDFLLNFDFFYLRGPLDLNPSYPITGNCSIYVYIDGSPIWNLSLLTLTQRGVWTDIGVIPIHLPSAPTSFLFEIGLEIDELLILDKRFDYDNNGLVDGSLHTQYITVYFDDLSFIAQTAPDCDVVDLEFSVNGLTSKIIGTGGTGSGLITKTDYWTLSPLSFSIYSNTSVSFDYCVDTLNHRFINSSRTTDISSLGVQYSITAGKSADLDFYTYLGIFGIYVNFTLRIYIPPDWQNITVHDPFLSDVTGNCIYDNGFIEISTDILDVLGWWRISCQSPNYAAEALTQRYETGYWVEDSVYHTNDKIRLSANISSQGNTPHLSDEVIFRWGLPNYTIWYEDSVTSGLFGSVTSISTTFGGTNTTAGLWYLSFFWINGTELAYGSVEFELHHQASLQIVYESSIEVPVGTSVNMFLRFYDDENGLLLTNNGAAISGTWAGGVVDFEPNLVKNWWEGVFDTSIVGAGNFLVAINSTAPFFETTVIYYTIKSEYETSLETPQGPIDALVYGRSYSFDFRYFAVFDDSGVDGANIDLSGVGSDWIDITQVGDGHYNVTLTPMGILDYNVRFTFYKTGFTNQTYVLSFLVDKVPLRVVMLSDLNKLENSDIDIEVKVIEDDTEILVSEANVTLSVISNTGDLYAFGEMNETSPGHYVARITMPPFSSEITYSINIQVTKENYELRQVYRDTLVPTFDADIRLAQQIALYAWPLSIGLIGFIGIVASQKRYAKKRLAKRMKAKAIKSRVDDANNLLGIIVLHKLSGIPIYSKILKGGFEEGMLSAFITAIMHFRSEFETTETTNDEYLVLPISDIIRAIPTQNLICAFITISSPSLEQEAKMIGFARAIGMTLDDTLSHRPTQLVDVKTAKTLEWYFDDFVDGGLVRKYQISEKKLPKRFKKIEAAMKFDSSEDIFGLNSLIRNLETTGLSEDDAYLLVMDAIELEFIVPIYPFNGDVPPESYES